MLILFILIHRFRTVIYILLIASRSTFYSSGQNHMIYASGSSQILLSNGFENTLLISSKY